MRLSIITINYNNLEGLKQTTASVLAQSFRDYEWIIIDGGSTDGSAEYIESLSTSCPNLAFSCSEKDNGVYDAMNKGIMKAEGEFLNFLNSGDSYFDSNVLQNMFSKEWNTDIIYGNCLYVKNGEETLKEYPPYVNLHYFLHSGLNHQATFIRRSILADVLYDISYKIAADYKFWLQCALKGRNFIRYPHPIVRYDDTGISSSDPDGTMAEIAQIREEILSPDFLSYEKDNYREYQILNAFPQFIQNYEKCQHHPLACKLMRAMCRLIITFLK